MYILLGYLLALLSSIITINGVPVTPLPDTNTNEYYCLGFLVYAPEIVYDNVNPFDLHSHVIDVVHDPPTSTSELEDMTKLSDHDSDTNENYIDNSKENEDSVNEQLNEQTNLVSDDVEPIKRRRRRRDNTELEQNKSPTSEDVESNTPTSDESIKNDPDTETNEKSSENTETTTITSSPAPPPSSVDDEEDQQQQQQQEEETPPKTIKCFEQKRERYNLNKLIHRYKSILFDLNIFQ